MRQNLPKIRSVYALLNSTEKSVEFLKEVHSKKLAREAEMKAQQEEAEKAASDAVTPGRMKKSDAGHRRASSRSRLSDVESRSRNDTIGKRNSHNRSAQRFSETMNSNPGGPGTPGSVNPKFRKKRVGSKFREAGNRVKLMNNVRGTK